MGYDGLSGISSVGNLFISYNESLSRINLPSLTNIDYQLIMSGNSLLENLEPG